MRLFLLSLFGIALLIAAPAHAQDTCPDGKPSYFGLCPGDAPSPRNNPQAPANPAPAPHSTGFTNEQLEAARLFNKTGAGESLWRAHNYSAAVAMLEEPASHGNTRAELILATIIGDPAKRDPAIHLDQTRAVALWKDVSAHSSDERETTLARVMLGIGATVGEGQPQDSAEAQRWFKLAAENRELALKIIDSFDVGDFMHRVTYRCANALGRATIDPTNAFATYMVGLCYLYPSGRIEGSVPEAVRWVRKAVALGYPESVWELGEFYAKGTGVPQSMAQACDYYAKAADLDSPPGAYSAGLCAADGLGGQPKNIVRATVLMQKAAAAKYADAIAWLKSHGG